MVKEERNFYVYVWFIKNTNEIFYVGKGKDRRYKTVSKRNKFFTDMYNTHDCDVSIVKNNLTEKEAFSYERLLISYIRQHTSYRLTNQTDGGEGASGYHPTKEVREKMSLANKQKWEDEEFRNRMLNIRNDPNGVYKSKEFREKISKIVQKENNPNYGNHWSKEQKDSLSNKKKNRNLGSENGNSKKIICLETGEIFECIKDAAEKYEIKNPSSISVALSEDVRTAAKMHWKYYNDDYLDDDARINTLIDVLSRSRNKTSFICLETKEIFITKKALLKYLKIEIDEFNNRINDGLIKYNNYNYVSIEKYVNCPVYQ